MGGTPGKDFEVNEAGVGTKCCLSAPTGAAPSPESSKALPVEVAPVSYSDHENFAEAVVYLITHAPISHADSPNTFFAFYLEASRRTGVEGKCRDGGHDAVLDGTVEAPQLALRQKGCQVPFSGDKGCIAFQKCKIWQYPGAWRRGPSLPQPLAPRPQPRTNNP